MEGTVHSQGVSACIVVAVNSVEKNQKFKARDAASRVYPIVPETHRRNNFACSKSEWYTKRKRHGLAYQYLSPHVVL